MTPNLLQRSQHACAACRTIQPDTALEPIPTDPSRKRCRDAAACWSRYSPRPLSRSVRGRGGS